MGYVNICLLGYFYLCRCIYVGLYKNAHVHSYQPIYLPTKQRMRVSPTEYPPCMAMAWRVLSRYSFPPAAPALSCHASHRGHLCQVSRVNASFSSVIGHKARKKQAAGHCSLQNLITSASTVLPAILNVRLGALRE